MAESNKPAAQSRNDESSAVADDDKKFVNTGLQHWEEARSEWLNHKSLDGPLLDPTMEVPHTAINIDVDDVIDLLISNKWRDVPGKKGGKEGKIDGSSFSKSIPLPQLIDILQDLWEAEGLEM